MAVKQYKPTSPGRRLSSGDSFSDITKNHPEKKLTAPIRKKAGRNNQGKITVRHRGGGAKRRYRLVDFSMSERLDEPATVIAIEYDPNRSARIVLLEYADGHRKYILGANGMEVDQKIVSTHGTADMTPGNRMPLSHIPVGTAVHNVELVPGRRATIVRSAGSSAVVMSADAGMVQVKLASGEIRKFNETCRASIGQVSNPDWGKIRWGKAGRMRYRGIRPTVRGKVMNPVDHPHGGGEGSSPIGLKHPKTPQGKPALGVKTRNKKKASSKYIVSSRKKRKR
ncbi:MAG: 50S ribosomal protein L2 [Candidatus Kerfeldbacteria bacterium CG15_BIG_FIL_POST_REV_8_21_14_020_45_12]|uniref:Large ribosomal subunit protein uL2 n=1 Tax=Candidatus Kerfeldbacteria bacterium CG15_BIG_FIL_POST_REV_8_21_14_020_45_12 TaxID=2014247 RepID=A0A2M7H3Q8_9BACT|nr:MAG: 50S ribosomal protein L2 [Candidatus Kerfeldbacteria bacterium CG15_BIG_FIL_POST_REV_8_21_14_020_45_12]PJA93987.1 MAG: 50S ribosomal protein L2 [Candidatus Kerfeldbacteria bacterium CG_4_9_14_3_um_filter_45_8]